MALALFALTACGGGGSGTGAGASGPAAVSFSPSSLTDVLFDGIGKKLRIVATPNRSFDSDVYVQLIDRTGVLQTTAEISELPDGAYAAVLKLRPLAIGRYQGKFEVRLCKNAACSEQHPGSPLQIPFDFDVRSHSRLSPLTALTAPDWTATQGSKTHAGYVPVTLDASRFAPRWLWQPPGPDGLAGLPVAQSGVAYLSATTNAGMSLVALDEGTAATRWQYDFGHLAVNQPTVGEGRVFVPNCDYNNAAMWGFDAVTGSNLFRTSFESQGYCYSDPVVHDGKVYSAGGYYGGMYGFDATTGTQDWFLALNQFFGWSPTVANGELMVPIRPAYPVASTYGPYKTGLTQVSFDGHWVGYTDDNREAIASTITDHGTWLSTGSIVASEDGRSVANNGVTLTGYGIQGGILWQLVGDYVANPAIAGNEVFAVKNGILEVRRLGDGVLLWSWAPEIAPANGVFIYAPVVTDNLVFFATDTKVYAIDRSSHKPVWSYPMAGNLALSAAGVLYVQLAEFDWSRVGILAAISLN